MNAYRFAASPDHIRRGMAFYARMFDTGPVLDIGSGRGHFLEAVRDRGIRGVGVDINEEAVAHARSLGLDAVVGDALAYLNEGRQFVGVMASHLVEHLHPDQVASLVASSFRSLAPGGRLVIVTPNPGDWQVISDVFWLDPTHVRPYPRRLIRAMLEQAGFVVEDTGLRPTPAGRRAIPRTLLRRLTHGLEYGRGEAWIRAHRPR